MEWCEIRVIFYADRDTRNKLSQVVNALAKNELGQLPPFIGRWSNRYADIVWSDSEEVLYYKVREKPNLEELISLADFYRCAFECTYKLPNSNGFNRVMYKDGILSDHTETNLLQDSTEIKVIDIDGNEKTITDLDRAISLTAEFMQYRHLDGSFSALDEKIRRYWADLNAKLNAIKNHRKNY